MGNFCELYEYISYFEDTSKEFCSWVAGERNGDQIILGYPMYSDEFENFIDYVYETDLLKQDYQQYLESLKDRDLIARIMETEKKMIILIKLTLKQLELY